MEEDLKDMLCKRPDELEGETLKLFNAIMKIADERDELKLKCKELKEIEESHRKENGELRERVKELEEENRVYHIKISNNLERIKQLENTNKKLYEIGKQDKYTSENYIPKSKVEEKIEELNEQIDKAIDNSKGGLDEEFIEKGSKLLEQKKVLQELLEKRKVENGN